MVNRLQIEKKKMNWGFITLVVLMSLGVFLSACTPQQTTQPTPLEDQGIVADDTQQVVDTTQPVPGEEEVQDTIVLEDVQADPKSEEEKTQDTINQLLADGTYDDEVTYRYHSGTETIGVSITVENDVVTAASITASEDAHPTSAKFINSVNDALADLVVGKNIADVQMPERVSGSSLTTAAFQGYVDSLVAQ